MLSPRALFTPPTQRECTIVVRPFGSWRVVALNNHGAALGFSLLTNYNLVSSSCGTVSHVSCYCSLASPRLRGRPCTVQRLYATCALASPTPPRPASCSNCYDVTCCGFRGFSTEFANRVERWRRIRPTISLGYPARRGSHYPVFNRKGCVCGFTHGLWEDSVLLATVSCAFLIFR